MLVLSRQRDETIMIGDDIELTIVDIRGDKVRIGIKAPSSVAVHRKEVYDAIKRENEQAARLGAIDLPAVRAGMNRRKDRNSAAGPGMPPATRLTNDGENPSQRETA